MSTSRKLVQRLQEINVHDFVRCYAYGELNRIILDGEFTEEELLDQWEILQMMYFDEVGGLRFQNSFASYKQLLLMRTDVDSIILLRELLTKYYYKPFALELNEICETDYEFNPEDLENYLEEINEAADCQLRYLRMEIQLKEIELEHQKKEEENSEHTTEEITEESFYENLIDLGNHSKIHLDDKISMFEYCKRIKKLKEAKSTNTTTDGRPE